MTKDLKKYFKKAFGKILVKARQNEFRTGWKDTLLRLEFGQKFANEVDARFIAKCITSLAPVYTKVTKSLVLDLVKILFVFEGNSSRLDKVIFPEVQPTTANYRGSYISMMFSELTLACEKVGLDKAAAFGFSYWVASMLDQGAHLVAFTGPLNSCSTEKRNRVAISMKDVDYETSVCTHCSLLLSEDIKSMANIQKVIFDPSIKRFSPLTLAVSLYETWERHWREYERIMTEYEKYRDSYCRCVYRLLTDPAHLPTGINDHFEAVAFLEYSNLVKEAVKRKSTGEFQPSDAKHFIVMLKELTHYSHSRLRERSVDDVASILQIEGFVDGRRGSDGTTVRVLRVNTQGRGDLRVGKIDQNYNGTSGMMGWISDAQGSIFISTLVDGTLSRLGKIYDFWVKNYYLATRGTSDIIDAFSMIDKSFLSEISEHIALEKCERLYLDGGKWYYGIHPAIARKFGVFDSSVTVDGPTTANAVKAAAALLSRQDGQPYCTAPNPFYSVDYRTAIKEDPATFRWLSKAGSSFSTGEPMVTGETELPTGKAATFTEAVSTFAPMVGRSTNAVLTNLCLATEVDQLKFYLSEIDDSFFAVIKPELMEVCSDLLKFYRSLFSDVVHAHILKTTITDRDMDRRSLLYFEANSSLDIACAFLDLIDGSIVPIINTIFNNAIQSEADTRAVIGM